MKSFFIALLSLLLTSPVFAQKSFGDSEIAISTGASIYRINSYDFKNGYKIGLHLNQGISKRIYTTIGISFGEDDGTYTKPSNWITKSTVRDIQLGVGIGVNVIQSSKHRIYLHSLVGGSAILGSSSSLENDGKQDVQSLREYNDLGLSTTLSTGYRYYLFNRIGVGVGYDFTYLHNIGHIHSFNATLSLRI